MRLHIALRDALVVELDRRAVVRKRSAFIGELSRQASEDERRWDEIESALGKIAVEGHDWDADPATWVRQQRQEDPRRSS